jgi:hypothetical protein
MITAINLHWPRLRPPAAGSFLGDCRFEFDSFDC